MSPADHPVHERTRRALIEDLGVDRFEELVAEGRGWTLEEAVEVALKNI